MRFCNTVKLTIGARLDGSTAYSVTHLQMMPIDPFMPEWSALPGYPTRVSRT
jgi:hypothetical protein